MLRFILSCFRPTQIARSPGHINRNPDEFPSRIPEEVNTEPVVSTSARDPEVSTTKFQEAVTEPQETRLEETTAELDQADIDHQDMLTRLDTHTRRFRVLIFGPRNAGKTTLLERLSNSPAGAAIITRHGERVMLQMLRLSRDLDLIFLCLLRSRGAPKGESQVGATPTGPHVPIP